MVYRHVPVLLKEAVEYLNISKGKNYIDATAGGGGYTIEILKRGGKVLGIDIDEDAIENVRKNFQFPISNFKFQIGEDVILVQGNFANLDVIAKLNGFENVSGIVFDLGLSSYHLEGSKRGFSFLRDEPLDMRMGEEINIKASDFVNTWTREELYEMFAKLGEEPNSLAIAENIVKSRRTKPIMTTAELVKIIENTVQDRGVIHPATKIFQALRMTVNNELQNLSSGLEKGFEILNKNGRLVVVSFQSLEDRMVKRYMVKKEKNGEGRMLTRKPVVARDEEIMTNRRSRSAKLRCIEKLI